MKKKPDRKWLAALALVVGAACVAAAPMQKKGAGQAAPIVIVRGE